MPTHQLLEVLSFLHINILTFRVINNIKIITCQLKSTNFFYYYIKIGLLNKHFGLAFYLFLGFGVTFHVN
jgi:hypothetical protein